MNYEPLEYWNERYEPNAGGIEKHTPNHLAFIEKHLEDVDSVLDVGPGTGRLFEAYVGIEKVNAYDISYMYESRLREVSEKLGIPLELEIGSDIIKLPYENELFDAVVATEVLLHVVPDLIEEKMWELLRVSKKVIAIAWMESGVGHGYHCFNYNYPQICEENGFNVLDFKMYNGQAMFVYN